jgi:hypothetical protein
MIETKPRWVRRPTGTTVAPAYTASPIDAMPAPREHPLLACNIDWVWIRAAIASGAAVPLVVDRADMRPLIDMVQSRLGHALVMRIRDDDVLWVCRPEAIDDDSAT